MLSPGLAVLNNCSFLHPASFTSVWKFFWPLQLDKKCFCLAKLFFGMEFYWCLPQWGYKQTSSKLIRKSEQYDKDKKTHDGKLAQCLNSSYDNKEMKVLFNISQRSSRFFSEVGFSNFLISACFWFFCLLMESGNCLTLNSLVQSVWCESRADEIFKNKSTAWPA